MGLDDLPVLQRTSGGSAVIDDVPVYEFASVTLSSGDVRTPAVILPIGILDEDGEKRLVYAHGCHVSEEKDSFVVAYVAHRPVKTVEDYTPVLRIRGVARRGDPEEPLPY